MSYSKQIIIGLCLIISQLSSGQIINPTFDYRLVSYCDITKIETNTNNTTVYFRYTAPSKYVNGGWVNVGNGFFIRDCDTKSNYKLINANNIPIGPKKHNFQYSGQTLEFNLVFDPLPTSTKKIDIIENEKKGGFNFFGVNLINQNNVSSNADYVSNNKHITDCTEIQYINGQNFSSKPSLQQRLNGCKKIYVPVPSSGTFIYGNFVNYLRELGLEVIEVPVKFNQKTFYVGTVFNKVDDYQGTDFFNGGVNDLGAVLIHLSQSGNYISNEIAKIAIVDFNNSYSWDFEVNIPNSGEKYKNRLKSTICSYRAFNPSASVIPAKRLTCWSESKIKQEFIDKGNDQIEGIYESTTSTNSGGIKYKLAVKKMNEKFYLIYLSGSKNDWEEGEIKATLEKTSSSNFYKAKWVMANKTENQDFYISFEQGLMTVIDPDKNKDIYIKLFPSASDITNSPSDASGSGSGYAISSNGYIITNHHVTNGAKSIKVRGVNGDFSTSYTAKIFIEDKNNDLSIIKIDDPKFTSLGTIPYIIANRTSDVGTSIFVLGYPLRATMGDEVKLTNGIISSKSGFQGDITSYQITAAVQPGNSGGPLFDSNGNIIGIVNAKHTGAENAAYAIKSSYLMNLIDLMTEPLKLQTVSTVVGKPLTEQVKILKKFTYIIEIN
jgi:S1-C subfamily serine protease